MTEAPIESLQPARIYDRKNNIGAIRLVLAVLVIYSHSYPLSLGKGTIEPLSAPTKGQVNAGELAVELFFLLSGYLIVKSWLSGRDALSFVRKRILRIYPGYLVAFCFSVGIGAACASPSAIRYLLSLCVDNSRLLHNVLFLDYGVLDRKGAFTDNPFPQFVNGSLWTLQLELYCYLLVAAAGSLGFFNRRAGVFCLCLALHLGYACNLLVLRVHDLGFWRLVTYFAYGAVFYCYRDRIPQRSPWLIALAVASIGIGAIIRPFLVILMPVASGYLLFCLAFAPYAPLHKIFDNTDISYGVYVYAFPVQQACVYALDIRQPLPLFAASVPTTMILAWLSWTFVEKPCLRWKPVTSGGVAAGGFPIL